MRVLSAALCMLVAASSVAAVPSPVIESPSQRLRGGVVSAPRIINGQDAQDGQIPYQVALFDAKKGYFCSGAIISSTAVITAGQCVDWTRGEIEVRAGTRYLDDKINQQQIRTTTLADRVLHPNFDMNYLDNDIAIIKLQEPLNIVQDQVEAILLPSYSRSDDMPGFPVTITGWGPTEKDSQPSNILQVAEIRLSDSASCKKEYGNKFIGTKLCAETVSGVSTCASDLGGPVMMTRLRKYYLVGITSFGSAEGCTVGKPIVFTRVASFYDFIEDNTDVRVKD